MCGRVGGKGKYSFEAVSFDYVNKKWPLEYDNKDHWEHANAVINRWHSLGCEDQIRERLGTG